MIRKVAVACAFSFLFLGAFAQISSDYTLDWSEELELDGKLWSEGIPAFNDLIETPLHGDLKVSLEMTKLDTLDLPEDLESYVDRLPQDYDLHHEILGTVRKQQRLSLSLTPIRMLRHGQVEIIKEFNVKIGSRGGSTVRRDPPIFAEQSVLRDGDIYKISVEEAGIVKLSYDFLKDIGVNVDGVPSTSISIYGNGFGPLPEALDDTRLDDVVQQPIWVRGGEDGSVDPGDHIYFYAGGPHRWVYNEIKDRYDRVTNPYDTRSYYFIKVGGSQSAMPITAQASLGDPQLEINTFTDYRRVEDELFNLLGEAASNNGSGQKWYGDNFSNQRTFNYSSRLSMPNLVDGSTARLQLEFVARSERSSSVIVTAHGSDFSQSISSTTVSNVEDDYGTTGVIQADFIVNTAMEGYEIDFPKSPIADVSMGWLDYISITAERELRKAGDQMIFRAPESSLVDRAKYIVADVAQGDEIWDISGPTARQNYTLSVGVAEFTQLGDTIREFVVFDPDAALTPVRSEGKIPNQNLHAITDADMLIVYHENFAVQAGKLAEHRRAQSGMTVEVVEVKSIFNEFASGGQDPTAIRDMCKMLYDRDEDFRYVLLFGDGSYDYRGIDTELADQNFIPVYETEQSLAPIFSFPSDDYYALLDDTEGENLLGLLDIAVGRLPVRNTAEANIVLDKILRYELEQSHKGDWLLRTGFIADDEDTNTHIDDAEIMATRTESNHNWVQQKKIYLDAYDQISTAGGQRYPEVVSDIDNEIFKGLLVTNYIGHGGNTGWAQERILSVGDILGWNNRDKLTLFVTATCSFMAYDDPAITSGGEHTLLSREGGAVALFSTVRSVFSSSNERLTRATFDHLYVPVDGQRPPIGLIMQKAKNTNFSSQTRKNSRKFSVFGDPSMPLAIPINDVVTTQINGENVNEAEPPTFGALDEVSISGEIRDATGNLMGDYQGLLSVTIFDKVVQVTTLVNDPSSRRKTFDTQENIVFRGNATVVDGAWEIDFVVPLDINLAVGQAKISYYAQSDADLLDAKGAYSDILVGGTGQNPIADDQGPTVDLYLDSYEFEYGDETGPSPILIVDLEDDFGINVVGNSIGHDLTGILDGERSGEFVINEFYEADLDDSRRGEARFPLRGLEPGRHSIAVKAWDIANNSGEGYTEFVVTNDLQIVLRDILPYPNPFTEFTIFRFLHDQADLEMDVTVEIYDVLGHPVASLFETTFSRNGLVDDIRWDVDQYNMVPGVYPYKLTVSARLLGSTEPIQAVASGKLIYTR